MGTVLHAEEVATTEGFEVMNKMSYTEARTHVSHPVSCIDCHDPQSMQLRVTRPGFMEGIRVLKAAQGTPDYDVNTMATRQEMRAFVCGQCHVEYYFKGPEQRLTYPWKNGLKADEILSYYQKIKSATGLMPSRRRRCSRRSIPSSRCGTRGSMPGPV